MAVYETIRNYVDAWQWTGSCLSDASAFCKKNKLPNFFIGSRQGKTGLVIQTKSGEKIASKGDFIVRFRGEYYVYDIFTFVKLFKEI